MAYNRSAVLAAVWLLARPALAWEKDGHENIVKSASVLLEQQQPNKFPEIQRFKDKMIYGARNEDGLLPFDPRPIQHFFNPQTYDKFNSMTFRVKPGLRFYRFSNFLSGLDFQAQSDALSQSQSRLMDAIKAYKADKKTTAYDNP